MSAAEDSERMCAPDRRACEEPEIPVHVRHLPRAREAFLAMARDDHVILRLPPAGATAGTVLRAASTTVEKFIHSHAPMKFKFGITQDVCHRFHNLSFGYKHGRNKFQKIIALYAAAQVFGPAFLEAALIDKYGRPLERCLLVCRCSFLLP